MKFVIKSGFLMYNGITLFLIFRLVVFIVVKVVLLLVLIFFVSNVL